MADSLENIKGKLIVNVLMEALPGKGDELAELLKATRDHARSDKEPGCLTARLARSGDCFVLFQEYVDKQALDEHMKALPMDDLINSKGVVLDSVDAAFYEEI